MQSTLWGAKRIVQPNAIRRLWSLKGDWAREPPAAAPHTLPSYTTCNHRKGKWKFSRWGTHANLIKERRTQNVSRGNVVPKRVSARAPNGEQNVRGGSPSRCAEDGGALQDSAADTMQLQPIAGLDLTWRRHGKQWAGDAEATICRSWQGKCIEGKRRGKEGGGRQDTRILCDRERKRT